FAFYQSLTPDPHYQLRDPFAQVECMPLEYHERASVSDMLAYAANTLTATPYQMRKYCHPSALHRLRELLQDKHYDALVCDFLVTAGVVPWELKIPTVIFTHNVEAVIW